MTPFCSSVMSSIRPTYRDIHEASSFGGGVQVFVCLFVIGMPTKLPLTFCHFLEPPHCIFRFFFQCSLVGPVELWCSAVKIFQGVITKMGRAQWNFWNVELWTVLLIRRHCHWRLERDCWWSETLTNTIAAIFQDDVLKPEVVSLPFMDGTYSDVISGHVTCSV